MPYIIDFSKLPDFDVNSYLDEQEKKRRQEEEAQRQADEEYRQHYDFINQRPAWQKLIDKIVPGGQFRTAPEPSAALPAFGDIDRQTGRQGANGFYVPNTTIGPATRVAMPTPEQQGAINEIAKIAGLRTSPSPLVSKEAALDTITKLAGLSTPPPPQNMNREEGFLQTFLEGFKTGQLETRKAQEYWKQRQGLPSDVAAIEKEIAAHPELGEAVPFDWSKDIKNPVKLLKHGIRGLAEQLPIWIGAAGEAAKQASLYGGTAGAAGAITGVGAPVLTGIGAAVGGIKGALDYTRQIEGGNAYEEFIKAGIDPKIASNVADLVGTANGAIEVFQEVTGLKTLPGVDKLFDGIKNRAAQYIVNSFTKRLAKGALQYGGTVGSETAQEIVQEAITMASRDAATTIDNAASNKNIATLTGPEKLQRLAQVAGESLLSFGLMPIPGMTANIALESIGKAARANAARSKQVETAPQIQQIPQRETAVSLPETVERPVRIAEQPVKTTPPSQVVAQKEIPAVEFIETPEETWKVPQKTAIGIIDQLWEEADKPFERYRAAAERHKEIVAKALSEGKPVPSEVLKDYPDLVAKVTPSTEVSEKTAPEIQKEAKQTPPPVKAEQNKVATGQKFEATLYRGSGKPKEQIYNYLQKPIAGEGEYYAFTEKDAKFYGDTITSKKVSLNNPLVIKNDDEWRALTKEAGWRFPNPVGNDNETISKWIDQLKELVVSKGHDGLVIQMDTRGDMAKTLKKVFGHDQVVVYPKETALPKAPQMANDVNIGDRVAWTSSSGEQLSGAVIGVDTDKGTLEVETEQVLSARGVPIGRIEFVSINNPTLQVIEKATATGQEAAKEGSIKTPAEATKKSIEKVTAKLNLIEWQDTSWYVVSNWKELDKAINEAIEKNDSNLLPDVPVEYYFGKNIALPSSPYPGIAFRGSVYEEFQDFLKTGKTGSFWTGNPARAFVGETPARVVFAGKGYGAPYDPVYNPEDNGIRTKNDIYVVWRYGDPNNPEYKGINGWKIIYKHPDFDLTKLNTFDKKENIPARYVREASKKEVTEEVPKEKEVVKEPPQEVTQEIQGEPQKPRAAETLPLPEYTGEPGIPIEVRPARTSNGKGYSLMDRNGIRFGEITTDWQEIVRRANEENRRLFEAAQAMKVANTTTYTLTETTKGMAINLKDFGKRPDLKAWAAKVVGLDPKYTFNRQWLDRAPEREMPYGRLISGVKVGDVLEINVPSSRNYENRKMFIVNWIGDKEIRLEEITPVEAKKHIEASQQAAVLGELGKSPVPEKSAAQEKPEQPSAQQQEKALPEANKILGELGKPQVAMQEAKPEKEKPAGKANEQTPAAKIKETPAIKGEAKSEETGKNLPELVPNNPQPLTELKNIGEPTVNRIGSSVYVDAGRWIGSDRVVVDRDMLPQGYRNRLQEWIAKARQIDILKDEQKVNRLVEHPPGERLIPLALDTKTIKNEEIPVVYLAREGDPDYSGRVLNAYLYKLAQKMDASLYLPDLKGIRPETQDAAKIYFVKDNQVVGIAMPVKMEDGIDYSFKQLITKMEAGKEPSAQEQARTSPEANKILGELGRPQATPGIVLNILSYADMLPGSLASRIENVKDWEVEDGELTAKTIIEADRRIVEELARDMERDMEVDKKRAEAGIRPRRIFVNKVPDGIEYSIKTPNGTVKTLLEIDQQQGRWAGKIRITVTTNEESKVQPEANKAEEAKETTIKESRAAKPEAGTVPPEQQEKTEIPVETTPVRRVAEYVKMQLKEGKSISSNQLLKVASEAFGGTMAEGKFTPKDAYDAMELGVNLYLLERKKSIGPAVSPEIARQNLQRIQEEILSKIPTQAIRRTEEQEDFQQFSTPPNLAYVVAWVANIHPEDVVLEPSAGTGSLAIFAKAAGAKEVIVNELSSRRAAILRELGFNRVFTENAEQLNNILPDDVKPTVILMNPPFSATAGRMKGVKNQTKNAITHIEQALKRLEEGGRLVAILGRGMADDTPTFRNWWNEIKKKYMVRANIGIDGKNYAKYGTRFDVQLVVIDKTGPTPSLKPMDTGKYENLEDVLPVLGVIKNAYQGAGRPGRTIEQAPGKPGGTSVSQESEGGVRGLSTVPVSTNTVGTGEQQIRGSRSEKPVREAGLSSGSVEHTVRNEAAGGHGPVDEGRPSTSGRRPVGGREDTGQAEKTQRGSDVSGGTVMGSAEVKEPVSGTRGQYDVGAERKEAQPEIALEKTEYRVEGELTDAVYTDYVPQKLKIPGANPHPGKLAQSAAMAAVEPPDPTYIPNMPKEIIEKGKLSLPQLEAVVYAGQAHQQTLPTGERRGFFIGDGTGVGKGREISAIILDNMRQGRKKAVWVSKNFTLVEDAKRDFGDIGGDPNLIIDFSKTKVGAPIKQQEGILFTTYHTLAQGLEASRYGELVAKTNLKTKSRLDQLVEWLGPDFDGVVAFDEAHEMQNSLSKKGKRGETKAAAKALAGIELQKKLPNARIVYVSATGATEVRNLAYAERLGLWGKGTPFANKKNFIDEIQTGGLAAMELVARDMKAMGVYLARNLSYDGVTYGTLLHELTTEQKEIYNTLARAWQVVLQNLHKALEETKQGRGQGNKRSSAIAAFWASQQRFFNQILTSMQMPSAIKQIEKDLTDGHAVVLQLVNTNEAIQNRELAKSEEKGIPLEDLDLTPREIIMQYLENSFPVEQYEEYTDENGNIRTRPVYDSKGNPVINKESLAMKERLMEQVGGMKVPEGPLEILLNTFGVENVAEATGRTRRVVKVRDNSGRVVARVENRTKRHVSADVDAFMQDKKRILVFSEAGGTGRSYHADLTKPNQRRRIHYLIQAGWRADNAVQGLGRTHRSNEASTPHYVLVTTDLKGHKRFISTIARRLDQLGALTKGQRQTGSQGLFGAEDNLENSIAKDTLYNFYHDLIRNDLHGLDGHDILTKMGLEHFIEDEGKPNKPNLQEEMRDVPKFLNRILTLEYEEQNKVFDAFYASFVWATEIARRNGMLEVGLETYRADRVKVLEESTVYTNETTNATTKYVALEAYHKVKKLTFQEAAKLNNLVAFYTNTKSSRVYAAVKGRDKTLPNGDVVGVYRLYGQIEGQYQEIEKNQLETGNWKRLSAEEAEPLWDKALEKTPDYSTERLHLISGTLLPIWDRLPQGHVRVVRVKVEDGRILLGRLIREREIDNTLRNLGATRAKQQYASDELVQKILEEGYSAMLANQWRIARRRVSGEYRIEIIGDDLWRYSDELKGDGVFVERIDWKTRFFIPTDDQASAVLERITKYRPVVEVVPPEEGTRGSSTYALKQGQKQGAGQRQEHKRTKKEAGSPVSIALPPAPEAPLTPKATREISDRILKALNTVIRTGRGKRVLGTIGWFDSKTLTGHVKRHKVDEWRSIGHEIGHAFEFIAGFTPNKKEMTAIADEYYPDANLPAKRKAREGFAEFFMLWFANNKLARELAPVTTQLLEQFLDANPQIAEVFREIEYTAAMDLAKDPWERIEATIARPGEKIAASRGKEYRVPWYKRPVFEYVDYSIPFQDVFKAAAERGYSGLDLGQLAAVTGSAPEIAVQWFNEIPRDFSGKPIIPNQKRSLKAIVDEAAKEPDGVKKFDQIYHALRYLERYARGFEDAPISKEDAKAIVKEAKKKYPKLLKLVIEYSRIFSKINLNALVKGGIISEETAKRVAKKSHFYLPLYHPREKGGLFGSGERRAAGQPVRRYQGSHEMSLNFLEASMLKLNETAMAVEINRVLQNLEKALKQPGMGVFGEIVSRPVVAKIIGVAQLQEQLQRQFGDFLGDEIADVDEVGDRVLRLFLAGSLRDIHVSEPILMVRHGDKETFLRVAPDIYRAVLAMKPPAINAAVKALAGISQVTRFGSLTNIRYMTNAIFRDLMQSRIQTKEQARSVGLGILQGMTVAAGLDPKLMDLYIQSAAYGSAPQEVLNSILRSRGDGLLSTPAPGWKRTTTGLFVRVVRSPIEALRILEEGPRIAEFKAVLERRLKMLGLTMEDLLDGNVPGSLTSQVEAALLEAAYASREVVANFGLHGANESFRRYVRTVPFMQGSLQGLYRFYRQVHNQPGRTLLRVLLWFLPITLMAWAASHDDDRYRDMPSESRDRYWWFPIGKGKTPFYIALAKPYEYILPINLMERYLDWVFDHQDVNRRTPLTDLGSAVKESFSLPLTSSLVSAILELMSNRNSLGSPIVPMREQQIAPELRYGPGTSETAIKLSRLFAGILGEKAPNPRQIDYLVNNVFGGAGKTAMAGIGALLPGANPAGTGQAGLEYTPVIGPLLYGPSEGGSRIVDKFYQDYSRAQMLYQSARQWQEKGVKPSMRVSQRDANLVQALPAMRAIANELSAMREELRNFAVSDAQPEAKRQANLRYNWIAKVYAGYLYGRPVPPPPDDTGINPGAIPDLLDYLANKTETAIVRAEKRAGGPR